MREVQTPHTRLHQREEDIHPEADPEHPTEDEGEGTTRTCSSFISSDGRSRQGGVLQ